MSRSLFPLALLAIALSPVAALAQREFGFDNRVPSGQEYLAPEETVKRMKVADGFKVELFAGEPDMTNPIAMTIDEKGRVWVVECFEYPERTPKDKMPRDRIRILEDTDGDGKADKSTLWAEGKNFPKRFDMASGIEVGYGGVFLGAPPYLWFLQDTDGDGKCDKYEILLEGFGSQDTHETLNTFQWGPDGRLYGLHGVFTESKVKEPGEDAAVDMNAAVWRYHHPTRKFEVFAEGTSNPWGMDWRNTDGEYILCCCVIPHLFHISPGGIYKRQAGASFLNPYVYGYMNEICDHTFHKESGWAHAGLISLDTPIMPEAFRDSVIFGSIHGCSIKHNILKPNGSTYLASRGEDFLVSGDKNFRPINMRWGPNGDIYLSDWHDQNPCHQAKPDSWDYERGRIYRIVRTDSETQRAEDLGAKPAAELIDLLHDPNPYRNRTALRLLQQNPKLLGEQERNALRERFAETGNFRDLSALVGVEPEACAPPAAEELKSLLDGFKDDPVARARLVRMTADLVEPTEGHVAVLTALAESETDARVRRELASAAQGLADDASTIGLLHALMKHSEDFGDPIIPQLIWLAYESRFAENTTAELSWLGANADGNDLLTGYLISRVSARMIAMEDPAALKECVAFLGRVSDVEVRKQILNGLTWSLQNRQLDPPANWLGVRATILEAADEETRKFVNQLSINFRDADAMRDALNVAVDGDRSPAERSRAVGNLGLGAPADALDPLIRLVREPDEPIQLRTEAVRALSGYDAPDIAGRLLTDWEAHPQPLRDEIVRLLAGRKPWAKALLEEVGAGRVDRRAISDNVALKIRSFRDDSLNAMIETHWGRYRPTPEKLDQLIAEMRKNLYVGGGSSFGRGKVVFETHCSKCHQFGGVGHEVGPKLDGAERSLEYLLGNVLDPNRVIGRPYYVRNISLLDGRVEQGLLESESDKQIVIKGEKGEKKTFQKADIDEVFTVEKSMMPEGLGYNMSEQDFRDLIRYVMADPFLTDVRVSYEPPVVNGEGKESTPTVGPGGRIQLADQETATKATIEATVTAPRDMDAALLLGVSDAFALSVNDTDYGEQPATEKERPDATRVHVALTKGENRVRITLTYKGEGPVIYARFRDPDRELTQADFSD